MTYQEKLKDPRWQRRRLEIFERDEWKCQACGSDKKTLHVHHKFYITGKDPWDYGDDALSTICERCHNDEHKLRKQFEQDLIESLRKRFSCYDIKELGDHIRSLADGRKSKDAVNIIGWLFGGAERFEEIVDERQKKIDSYGYKA